MLRYTCELALLVSYTFCRFGEMKGVYSGRFSKPVDGKERVKEERLVRRQDTGEGGVSFFTLACDVCLWTLALLLFWGGCCVIRSCPQNILRKQ